VKQRSWTIAIFTIVVLMIASYAHEIVSRVPGYNSLHNHRPFYAAESIDKLLGALLCLIAVWLMHGRSPRAIGRELGFSAPALPALAFALIASSPMLLGFAITRTLTPHLQLLPLIFLTVFSPLVEELEFRGFGVRHLQRGTGWPFWLVVWPSSVLFGYGHVEQGQQLSEMAGLFLLTGSGGVIFAWLLYKWENLWVPVFLHICMNLWWELFSVAKTAVGGWFPFALQSLTMLLSILITFYRKPSRPPAVSSVTG